MNRSVILGLAGMLSIACVMAGPARQPLGARKVYFERLYVNQSVAHEFELRNLNFRSLKLQGTKVSCNCTVPRTKMEGLVWPFQRIRVPVNFKAQRHSGRQASQITIAVEGMAPIILDLEAEVKYPETISIGSLIEGEEHVLEIKVPEPLESSVPKQTAFLTVLDINNLGKPDAGAVVRLRISPDAQLGPFSELIEFSTQRMTSPVFQLRVAGDILASETSQPLTDIVKVSHGN